MEYVRVGNSGLKVSKIILGAMSFGAPNIQKWTLPTAQALPIIKYAFDQGINTWDTADIYALGDSERILGQALRTYSIPRSRVVILSKCYGGVFDADNLEGMSEMEVFANMTVNDGVMVNRVGLSRKHIFDAVEASCERLGTYIDVLQIHRLDPGVEGEEIMRALNDVVESGKVRYIGSSSMATWEFQNLQNIAARHGWHQFISMQDYHSPLYRESEREMLPYCRATGVGYLPFSPLARGLIARPYKPSTATADATSIKRQDNDHYSALMTGVTTSADIEIIGRIEKLAEKEGVSMATIALAWHLVKGNMPIVGLGSEERVRQAVDAVKLVKDGKFGEAEAKVLDEPYVAKGVLSVI